MARIHGKNGVVYLQGAGANAQPLSTAADYSIDGDFDSSSVGAMGDIWDSSVQGLLKWTANLSGPIDTASTLPWDSFVAGAARNFYLYPQATVPTSYYYGTCWPNLSVKGGTTSAVTFSGKLTGSGPLSTH